MGLGETQKIVQQIVQAPAFLLDQFDFFHRPAIAGRIALAQVLGKQFHVQADGGERIFYLVRQSAGQAHELGILIDEFLVDFVGGFGCGTWHGERSGQWSVDSGQWSVDSGQWKARNRKRFPLFIHPSYFILL